MLPIVLEALTGSVPAVPQYYDYQAKGKYYFNKNHSITLLVFGFGDTYDNPAPALTAGSRSQAFSDGADPYLLDLSQSQLINTYVQMLTYSFSPSENLSNALKLYSSLNSVTSSISNVNPNAPLWMKDVSVSANSDIFGLNDEFSFKLFDNHISTRIGLGITYYDFSANGKELILVQYGSPTDFSSLSFKVADLNQKSSSFVYSGYFEEKVEFGGFKVFGGLRAEYFNKDNLYTIDPEGILSYEFPTSTTVSVGAGTYCSFIQTNYLWYVNLPDIADWTNLEVEKAYHYTAGIEQKIVKIYFIKIEGFYESFDHLFMPAADIMVNGRTAQGQNSGMRRVSGFESTLKKEPEDIKYDFYGWINYTYMEGSQKSGLPLSYDPYGSIWINDPYLRQYALKIVFGFKFYNNHIGLRFRLLSSQLYTPITGDDGDSRRIGRFGPVYGKSFSQFYPLYHQLDIRFSRQSSFKWGKISWYIEIQNIYNNHVPELKWNYSKPYNGRSDPVIDSAQGLGILPGFGVEVQF